MRQSKFIKFFSRIDTMNIRYFWLIALICYVVISFIFSRSTFWADLNPQSHRTEYVGEFPASEWGLEKIYQKIIHKENPYSSIREVLYPFGIDVVASDIGTAFYFPLLRPFLSTHQSLVFLIIAGTIAANIGMTALLMRFKVNRGIALVLGLAFGHMTFLVPRVGHPIYISSTFLIPWFFLFLVIFFQSKNTKVKVITSGVASFLLVFTLWQHMYYFIILLLSMIILGGYWGIFRVRESIAVVKRYWLYVLCNGVFMLLFLLPWLNTLYKIMLFSETPRPRGWSGAIELSSDLFGFFIPSVYNYYYGEIILPILLRIPFASKGLFENFTYPGLLIIGSYVLFLSIRKKIPPAIKKVIFPFFWTSVAFAVLTLGPFLHILDNWWVEVDEGIRLVLPLPFAVLHYMPFLSNIRAPGRLIVGFIFFAYIVSGFVLTAYLRNKSARFKTVAFIFLFFIFVLDQRTQNRWSGGPVPIVPNKIFSTIARDPGPVSVLEIPFVVRDGLSYFGNYHSTALIIAQSFHKKPILGGYSGRISDYIKIYYQNNPLFGYLGRIIDPDISENRSYDKTDISTWLTSPDIEGSKKTVEFLNMKYVFLKEQPFYENDQHVASATAFLQRVGFIRKLRDKDYSLWQYPLEGAEFLDTRIGTPMDDLFLGFGWYSREGKFRWVSRRSFVMFKVNKSRRMTLHLSAASFYKKNKAKIYVNKKQAGEIVLSPEVKKYSIKLTAPFEKGINFIYFIFDKKYYPAQVFPNNADARALSARFMELFVTE